MSLLTQGRQLLLNIALKEKLLPLLGCLSRGLTSTWNYEEEKKHFKLQAPPYYNFARDVIDKWADKEKTGERGNNPAFWWVDESGKELKWSFQDVSYQSKLVANVLKEACKLETNDVVIVILPRIPQWWAINVAAIRAGIILSPGTTLLRPSDVRYRINASNAKCVITNAQCADIVDEVAEFCPSLQSKIIVGEGENRTGWMNYEELVRKSTDNFQCIMSKADDPMTIFFTSGTTGAPKMTEHSHSSYGLGHLITARILAERDFGQGFYLVPLLELSTQVLLTSRVAAVKEIYEQYFLDLSPNDVLWNLSDTGWAKCAWSSLFSPWIAGACVFVQDSPKFDPQQTLQTIGRYPISHFCAPPTAVRFLVKTDMKLYRMASLRHCLSAGEPVILLSKPISKFCAPPTAVRFMQVEHNFPEIRKHKYLHLCVSGGEPVNPELLEEWEEGTGLKLYEGYGQTETTFLCGTYSSIEQRPGSMGKPAPGYDIQVVDDNGQVLPRGKEGNIGILCKPQKPVGLFSRYIDDPERMQSVFVGDYYLTGDRAIMDEDDYVWFVGRADDVIISSGYRIGPFEVESALLEHPAVLESAVVSSPDYNRGEVVKAFVTLTESHRMSDQVQLAKELQEHTKTVTAPYKYPRKIEFVDTLPKTVSGKIRRVELRNKEWGRDEE